MCTDLRGACRLLGSAEAAADTLVSQAPCARDGLTEEEWYLGVEALHSGCTCRAMVALMGTGDAESAAILTPYNGQVRLIRRILKEHTGELYSKVQRPSTWPYMLHHHLMAKGRWACNVKCALCPNLPRSLCCVLCFMASREDLRLAALYLKSLYLARALALSAHDV